MLKMKSLLGLVAFGVLELVSGSPAIAQTVERDTTVTGPRGRTIKRQVEVQRTPGGIDRSIKIQRPGGTFDRQVQVQRSVTGGPWRPPGGGPGRGLRGFPGPS